LERYDEGLSDEGLMDVTAEDVVVESGHSPVFFTHVLLPLVDENDDKVVTHSELVSLQLRYVQVRSHTYPYQARSICS
jgi:hypothetical protein